MLFFHRYAMTVWYFDAEERAEDIASLVKGKV